jgi:hypothetical protein
MKFIALSQLKREGRELPPGPVKRGGIRLNRAVTLFGNLYIRIGIGIVNIFGDILLLFPAAFFNLTLRVFPIGVVASGPRLVFGYERLRFALCFVYHADLLG